MGTAENQMRQANAARAAKLIQDKANEAARLKVPAIRAAFYDRWMVVPVTFSGLRDRYQDALKTQASNYQTGVNNPQSRYPQRWSKGWPVFSVNEIQDFSTAYMNTPEYQAMTSGGLFGGLGAALSKAVGQIARPALQVSTLGHADQVIHAGQVVARNPLVQAMAASALTVYTGGLAAGALGGGALATAGGTMIASAGVGKIQGSSFSLKNSMVTGATAGIGAYAKTAQLVANPAMNAGLVNSLSHATVNKLQGNSFSLKNTAMAGAAAALPAAGQMYKADLIASLGDYAPSAETVKSLQDNLQQAKQIKSVVDNVKAAQKAFSDYKAAKQQGADMVAANAELAALNAEITKAQQQGNPVALQVAAQAIIEHPAVVAAQAPNKTAQGATKAAAMGVVALKLLAFI